MSFSILTVLVAVESFIILLIFLAYYINKNSKLKKSIDDLLLRLSESLFSKLIQEEIDKTIERINETSFAVDELELADVENNDNDSSSNETNLKKILTFRSSYLHAEINAYDASDGDPGLFWHYLAENIASLIPEPLPETDTPMKESNEFIDEVMQELQQRLDKSIESNIVLQSLLDSLLNEGTLAAEQIQIIKNSQADFHDLSQQVSDLDNKIQNSLNIEITSTPGRAKTDTTESTVYIEKASHVVNTEVNKLKDVIYEQGNQINALLKSLKDENHNLDPDGTLHQHLSALEKTQNETAMCIEVLEMENHRLMEEIDTLQNSIAIPPIDGLDIDDMGPEQLKLKIHVQDKIIKDKDEENTNLKADLKALEQEFMAVYKKNSEKD